MNITVFGATGRTGKLIVRKALKQGHTVTAAVRDPAKFSRDSENLRVAGVDVFDTTSVKSALAGSEAVISALGLNSRKDTTPLCSTGTANITSAMDTLRIRRLVVLSAAPVLRSGAGESLAHRMTMRPIARAIFRNNYADLEQMEDHLMRTSDIQWTILRPGYLTEEGKGTYRTAVEINVPGGTHRGDLADAMLAVLEDSGTHRSAMGIAST